MASDQDVLDSFEETIRTRERTNPWQGAVFPRAYAPDYDLLSKLVAIPIRAASGSATGRLAKAVDAWAANEFRRAGFEDDEVWPRLTKPRILPRDLALYLKALPAEERRAAQARVLRNKRVAPSDARVLGRAYVKQVDVLIAQWSRGPELLVSTKSMVSSFRNNLPNRFEESYGDAKNLRGRYPLVSMGFLFLLRSTVAGETGTLERVIDMLRKLQADDEAYDATCLVLAEWADPPSFSTVTIRNDLVPEGIRADHFLSTLIDKVLTRTPIDMHVAVRKCRSFEEAEKASAEDT